MKTVNIFKNIGISGETWYTRYRSDYTKEEIQLEYLEEDVNLALTLSYGWDLSAVLRYLVNEQRLRKGKEEVKEFLL